MKDEKIIREFADLLKKAKNHLKMSHTAFGIWLDVPRDTYMNWYNATRRPTPDTIRLDIIDRIRKELGITI